MEGVPLRWEANDEEAECNRNPAMDTALEIWSSKFAQVGDRIVKVLDSHDCEFVSDGLVAQRAFAGFCEEDVAVEAARVVAALAEPITRRLRTLGKLTVCLELEPNGHTVDEYRKYLSES